ncbi:unnamed protein product [Bursaphelenchus xylophilus]|uniref:Nucleolar protein 10 n=1 Tax=Bursaphelenchus xylophilus TaxID=6326 RepID=A0A1I7RHC4_BURXY|nr:unnamed protein product [Bursaphelenchus xylophilus]CAG9115852.1 unnamed protein product [Bursaphelenchus xylophilus]
MQVSKSNDVKIYNLSAGKSLPQWISERKRRNLEKKDVDIRRRIQLIQDFEMPCVSNSIAITGDGQYIYAAGTYKPTLKCYDVNDLSLKFERGLDAEVVKLLPLSEDYSKVALLQTERWLEFHARFGRYFRLRIPKVGRDLAFCNEASDLYMVGAGHEIFRLNLEQGCFLSPLETESETLNCCEFSKHHQLFVTGGSNATVEAWDHRDKNRAGILNCALQQLQEEALLPDAIPEVTSVKFKDPLTLAVGMSTGHVLIYDIRAKQPRLVKNHNFGLAITSLDFDNDKDLVLSMDSRALKVWNIKTGKPYAAIEPNTHLTQFVRYPDSGLLFFANDAPKMLQYFVPSLGLAPKWCRYLDNITEELEETEAPVVYDDYKFVTKEQLEEVGLSNLIGSNLLRAYMHGYFIDVRLYNKAKTLTQPFAFESYRNRKIQEKLDEERELHVLSKRSKLPKVNKELATKLQMELDIGTGKKKKAKMAKELLQDDRFKNLFSNPDFEVDKESEQYQHIVDKLNKQKEKNVGRTAESDEEDEGGDQLAELGYDDDEDSKKSGVKDVVDDMESSEDWSDDEDGEEDYHDEESEEEYNEESSRGDREEQEKLEEKFKEARKPKNFKFVGLDSSRDFKSFVSNDDDEITVRTSGTMKDRRKQLGEIKNDDGITSTPFGGKSMTFTLEADGKSAESKKRESRMQTHIEERKAVRRTVGPIMRHLKPLPSEIQKKKMQRLKGRK